MQRLAAAPEQAVVRRVLDQRVLEAIIGLRRRALHKQKVGVGQPLQRGLQSRLVVFGDVAQKPVCEITSEHRADLRDLARGAQPVEARGERLLERRRDRLHAALIAALEQEPRHLLDEQRHAAGARVDALDQFA